MNNEITINQAKLIALDQAKRDLSFIKDDNSHIEYIDNTVRSFQSCWIFFRNGNIKIPDEHRLKADYAYAVSKKGDILLIGTQSEDDKEYESYLREVDSYFRNK